MSNIIKAINDDMDHYTYLCEKYGEKPQYSRDARGNQLLDCYGEHAKKLEERLRAEQKQ